MGQRLLEAYFGKNGSQYNMGRLPMGGTDFSPKIYNYDDQTTEDDYELKHWSLAEEDFRFKIPFVKRAMELSSANGNELKLFFSPWGAPAWMTDNHSVFGGHLKNDLAYRARALSFVKFLNAYKEQGIQFWGATVQNQAIKLMKNKVIASVGFCNDELRKFIADYLGPILEENNYGKRDGFKLMIGDDCFGLLELQVPQLMQNHSVSRYISGLAYHNYYEGVYVDYKAISNLYEPLKDKFEFLLMTEGCENNTIHAIGADPGDWLRGEHYASDIIEDLLRDTSGWLDWNLALDMEGGPNNRNVTIDACISVDLEANEFYKLPTYYTFSHFSRFFKPGSRRVEASPTSDFDDKDRDLMYVAVRDSGESGHLVVNVLNRARRQQEIKLVINGLEGHSDKTEVYELDGVVLEPKSLSSILIKI